MKERKESTFKANSLFFEKPLQNSRLGGIWGLSLQGWELLILVGWDILQFHDSPGLAQPLEIPAGSHPEGSVLLSGTAKEAFAHSQPMVLGWGGQGKGWDGRASGVGIRAAQPRPAAFP